MYLRRNCCIKTCHRHWSGSLWMCARWTAGSSPFPSTTLCGEYFRVSGPKWKTQNWNWCIYDATRSTSISEKWTSRYIDVIFGISALSDSFFLMRYNITSPAYKKVVPGEGMPLSHNVSTKGNLIITFDVHFPEKLSPESKQLIKRALSFKQSNVKDNVKV